MKQVGGLIESGCVALGALKWSRIALMGSLQISTGSALGKSSMQE